MSASQPANGTPCPRCHGTDFIYPELAELIADECWAARKPDGYIAAIRDFRVRTDGAFSLRETKDYIDAAKGRNP